MMKIAIVGGAPSSRDLAPYDDTEWTIWTLSPANRGLVKRADAWFELHALSDLESPRWREWNGTYLKYLRGLSVPVYMQTKNDLVPNAVVFPTSDIAEFDAAFFTSSMAMMLAYAITLKPEELAVYGVDCSSDGEYGYERPGVQYFVRLARQRGIKVTIPPESDLDAPVPIYGYDCASPMAIKLKQHAYELRARIGLKEKRLEEINNEKAQLLNDIAFLRGAVDNNRYVRRTFIAWSGEDL